MPSQRLLFIMRLVVCCALGFGSAASLAAGKGGFSGPSLDMSTVEQAKTMNDDAPIIVRGNIIKHLGKDKYLFRDATGEITVEIDNDEWNGQTVTPGDLVELRGEIDKEWNRVEIDIDQVTMVK